MELHPLRLPDMADMVNRGNVRQIRRGPSTIGEVLERGRAAMQLEDEAEQYRDDPLTYLRAHRPRRRLLDRLLHGKGTHR